MAIVNKQGKSSSKRMPIGWQIFIIDLIAVALLGVGLAIDLAVVPGWSARITLLSIDSVISLSSFIYDFFTPNRGDKIIKKYCLTVDDYDYLGIPSQSVQINLWIVYPVIIVFDIIVCLFDLNIALIFSLFVELLLFVFFFDPVIMLGLNKDEALIRRCANKFSSLDREDEKHFIYLKEFIPSDNYRTQGKSLERILGSILINNDEQLVFKFFYKRFKSNDEGQNAITKGNLYYYFIYVVSSYLDYIEPMFEEHVFDDRQVRLIIENIRSLKLSIDLLVDDGFLRLLTYIYIANSLFRLGNVVSSHSRYSNTLDDVFKVIISIEDSSYKIGYKDNHQFNEDDLLVLSYLFFHSLIERQTWFLDKYPKTDFFKKHRSHEYNYYLSYPVFCFSILKAIHITSSRYGNNSRQIYFDTFDSIIKEKYSNEFYVMIDSTEPKEFIFIYYYLERMSKMDSFGNDESVSNLYLFLNIDLDDNDNEPMLFWFTILLIRVFNDAASYDNLEQYLDADMENEIIRLCHLFKDNTEDYRPLIDSVFEYAYKPDYLQSFYNKLDETIDYILNFPSRKKAYEDLKKNSGIKKLIDNLNKELEDDPDFIDIKSLGDLKNQLKTYDMCYIYCTDEHANQLLKDEYNFPTKKEFLNYLFDHIEYLYEDKSKKKAIRYYTNSEVNEIKSFNPDHAFMSDEYNNFVSMHAINDILQNIDIPHKYLSNNYMYNFHTFYKDGAVKYYAKISYKETYLRPATSDIYQHLIDSHFGRDDFEKYDALTLQEVVNSSSFLYLHVEYIVNFDFNKMLIYLPSWYNDEYYVNEDD